jgi:MSHA biogenesis protein MshO
MTIRHRPSAGFTLIEMIMVIVITGIIAGIVAVFITAPVQGYVDSVRRAELTDQADVALRRIARDVRLALPNSLRVTTSGGIHYIEFIMTSTGGRYRDPADGSTGGNFLSFTSSTSSFDVMGALPSSPAIQPGDYLVVYNLGSGYSPSDAYSGGNVVQVDAAWSGTSPVVLTAATRTVFSSQSPPLSSPSARFQVIPGGVRAVTFACPSAAGNLTRYWNYGFNATQAIPSGGSSALLASNAACVVDYTSAATGRNGLLYIGLTLSSGGESVTLFNQIHVDNSP